MVYQFKKTSKRKKKKNKKQGKGFGDGFKFLYSLGKQWRNSMQWNVKRTTRWLNLIHPKRWLYQTVARYKRISRGELLPNIVMRRTYTQRAAPRGWTRSAAQQGQGIFNFIKKVARNPLVKSIARKGLEYAPGAY